MHGFRGIGGHPVIHLIFDTGQTASVHTAHQDFVVQEGRATVFLTQMVKDQQVLDNIRSTHHTIDFIAGDHPQDSAQIVQAISHRRGMAAHIGDIASRVIRAK